jgi:hypothetical protein
MKTGRKFDPASPAGKRVPPPRRVREHPPISLTQLQIFTGSVSFKFMRLLRVLLVGLFGVFALLAGLLTAAVVGVATALALLVRRMLRQPDAVRLPRQAPPRARTNSDDVIDVTATELPVDSTPR